MLAVGFLSADGPTIHATAILATVTNHSIPVDETGSVCSGKYKIDVGEVTGIRTRIPDRELFSLKRSKVVQTWEKKRLNILGLVGARNKTARANMKFAITFVSG